VKRVAPAPRIALSLLAVCLLISTGCGRPPVDQLDLTTLLPGEPAWIVSSDLRSLQQSETWHELQGLWMGGSGLPAGVEQFLDEAGIDREKDLARLMGGLYDNGTQNVEFAAVLTGRFDRRQLLPALERQGFTIGAHREVPLLTPPDRGGHGGPDPDHPFLVCFDDTAIGLAATEAGAAGLIDRLLDGGESLEQHPEFGPLLAEMDRTSPLWAAGLLAAEDMEGLDSRLPMKGMIPALSNLGISAWTEEGLQLSAVTLLADAEAATKLAGQLNGWVKLAAGLMQANPQWFGEAAADADDDTLPLVVETLDKVIVGSVASAVRLEADIPAELLRRAAEQVGTTSPASTGLPRQE